MRLVRGRGADPEADRRATAEMLAGVADGDEAALRVWTPHRQLAFGRRDARAEGYERARELARVRGFPPVERSVGGRAVAYTGTTVAFAHAVPVADVREGLQERYDAAVAAVADALGGLGVDAARGEPAHSFCPGAHSLQAGGKVAGVAQRVRSGAALVGGCVVVDAADEVAGVLAPVYDALGVAFDPDSVGSVAAAGGPADPDRVARALERAVVNGRDASVEYVDGYPPPED